ncbi:uncharacterized protein LOC118269991 [Spodoptera frugiperda]|uniref:Uncharacterized protein LOC118269991 n=1 Tax=Spodoptera frugiperda TaxID=7108 RepID=A0A9R0EDD4_SPOFR|nr:uncharacterized protein LOC118269991 [Spodoptera frugiperda]
MNFQTNKVSLPVRVMVINPLIPASQLFITKILSGVIFGRSQLVDLILLVYANEIDAAHVLGQELIACAFPCYNSVIVTSDLPTLADADVFCFMTHFVNPNKFDFKEDKDLDKDKANQQFDNFYLIIKIATSLGKPPTDKGPVKPAVDEDTGETIQPRKPIILTDGILTLDILMIVANTLPQDVMLFSTTPLRSIAKITLSEFLKVRCCDLNQAYVWAANDTVFHAEIVEPFLIEDKVVQSHWCDWNAMSPEMLETLGLEHINFNASWMKREFIEKMVTFSKANPYGSIFKAAELSRTLNAIWQPRCIDDNVSTSYTSVGVISDGSLGTIKGKIRGGSIPVELQVMAAIRYWGRHEIQEDCAEIHGMSQQTLSRTAKRVAIALASKSSIYIKMPSNLREETETIRKFEAIYLKICDIVCHWRGSTHDARIWRESSIKRRFEEREFKGKLIGDGGYPCTPYLLTPVLRPRNEAERRYNYSHIRTRNLVPYCKKFLQENVIDKAFIPALVDSETTSVFSSVDEGSYNSGSD